MKRATGAIIIATYLIIALVGLPLGIYCLIAPGASMIKITLCALYLLSFVAIRIALTRYVAHEDAAQTTTAHDTSVR